jgi:hypothetical protein
MRIEEKKGTKKVMVMLFEILLVFPPTNNLESTQTCFESAPLINSANNDRPATRRLQTRCGVTAT